MTEARATFRHSAVLERSSTCGCFYCLAQFPPGEIVEWWDDGETAECPRCGIDSVMGDADGPVDEATLRERQRESFSALGHPD